MTNHRILCAGVLLSGLAWGQDHFSLDAALHNSDRPFIQATGQATISATPDQALINVAVVSEDDTTAAAVAKNAKQAGVVVTALTGEVGANHLKTVGYSVRPNYKFPKPGAPAAISGYIATNVVEVTLDDLARVSKVIDDASRLGANIQSLQYQLKDPGTVRAQLLKLASERAKTSAEAIAAGLGLKLARVWSAEEVSSEDITPMAKKAPVVMSAQAATPVETGTIDVTARVMLRMEIAQ